MSKIFLSLFFLLVMTACSTEENLIGSLDAGAGAAGGGAVPVGTKAITVSWVAPVDREDGTPITMAEIAGYRVYYGDEAGRYTSEVDVDGSDTMQVTLDSLPAGTYYIVVTTIDQDGRESVFSDMIVANA